MKEARATAGTLHALQSGRGTVGGTVGGRREAGGDCVGPSALVMGRL